MDTEPRARERTRARLVFIWLNGDDVRITPPYRLVMRLLCEGPLFSVLYNDGRGITGEFVLTI